MARTLLMLAALAAAFIRPVLGAADTLKLATLAPEGSPWHELIVDIGEKWKAASGGRITLRIYPGGVTGDEADMIRKMRIGQLQAAALTGAGLARIAPEIQALQMPMVFASYEELDYVRDRIAPKLAAITEKQGFKILNWGDAGWVRFFAKRLIVRPEDLKPLKIFTWEGDTTYLEAMKEMGYQPVPLAATDIYTALQSGLIDAFPTTPIAALSFQWFGLANHMADVRWAAVIGALVVSTKAWQTVPDDLKPVLARSAADGAVQARAKIRPLEDQAIAAMQTHGLVVHAVPPEALAEWEATARIGDQKIVGKAVPAAMVAEIERLRDEYRAAKKSQ